MIDRILHLFGQARATLIDDTGPIQLIQADEGAIAPAATRITNKVRRVLEFGFASFPPLQSEILLARVAGDRSRTLAIGSNHQPSRLKDLSEGDAAIYDVRGAYVWLTADGLVIDAAGLDVTIRNATNVTIIASDKVRLEAPIVETTGDFVSRADGASVSLNALHDAYNAHGHTAVKAGPDVSGATDHPV